MKTFVHKKIISGITVLTALFLFANAFAQSGTGGTSGSGSGSGAAPAPELIFSNPVLVSGVENTQGAIYRYANVTEGIDAEVKLKTFSRPDIVMRTIDNSTFGWDKAFQPEFGLPGVVAPFQNWYIDFEVKFYEAGTANKTIVEKFDITSLDIDGDGYSISEYIKLEKPASVTYSTISYLTGTAGTSDDGLETIDINGPIDNFVNIDTAATQVMAAYQYLDKDGFNFRMGGKSSSGQSRSGIRLNSMWFRSFSLAPAKILPVKLTSFTTLLNNSTVTVNWTTAEEKDFSHFVIEKSTNGKNFTQLAVVFSMGTESGTTNYAYKDANVASASGVIYYRLRSVDHTTESSLSQVRVIKLGKEQVATTLATYPNPVREQLKITLPNAWQNKAVSIELYTMHGIKVQSVQKSNASQTEELNLNSLSKGIYLVKASCEGHIAQQRVIKN